MNETKAEGMLDQAKGKIKQAFGDATGDQKTANSGAADEVKGHAKEAWGNVKDTASDLNSRSAAQRDEHVAAESHDTRDSITSAAKNAKDSINRGLHNLDQKAHQ